MAAWFRRSAERPVVVQEQRPGGRSVWAMVGTIVNIVFGIIELLLLARFVLRLLGANAATPFIAWIYQISQPLIAPFAGAFGATASGTGSVVEWATLLAVAVFALVAWVIGLAISAVVGRTARAV
jgi:YggT family protein